MIFFPPNRNELTLQVVGVELFDDGDTRSAILTWNPCTYVLMLALRDCGRLVEAKRVTTPLEAANYLETYAWPDTPPTTLTDVSLIPLRNMTWEERQQWKHR